MAGDTTHSLVSLGLLLADVKGKIAALREREQQATDPDEIQQLRRERQGNENKEAAILKEMKDLQAERRSSS
jgi:predicted  nucleic acid-binding Zn-ribbon protein